MHEINKLILEIYHSSQHTAINEFPDKVFSLVKHQIGFDSGGFCDFDFNASSGIKLVSAAAHNISAHDKLRARQEYIDAEVVQGKNRLSTADPALAQAFKNKGRAVSLSLRQKGLKSNVVAYGTKTDSHQTMTMVMTPPIAKRFQTVSLWRGKNNVEYVATDDAKANLILPHLFQAFGINRQLHQSSDAAVTGSAISSLQGTILFIDEVAANFLLTEFQTWNPPFLPELLLEKLRSTPGKIYIGKQFTLTARRQKDILFLYFKRTRKLEKLSPTELVIAQMLARNETYKEIAQKLGNQPATVRNQAHSIYVKFGISGKAGLTNLLQQ